LGGPVNSHGFLEVTEEKSLEIYDQAAQSGVWQVNFSKSRRPPPIKLNRSLQKPHMSGFDIGGGHTDICCFVGPEKLTYDAT